MVVCVTAAFLSAASRTTARAADITVSTAKANPPKALAAAIRDTLDHTAITTSDGKDPLAEFWLRTEMPSGASVEKVKAGLTLKDIHETAVLGAVRFAKDFTDYRKQSIPAGVYVMRFAVQPETGDHKDTAPHSTFALLTPPDKDRDVDTLDLKDAVKLSRLATAADHPAVLLLFPVKKPGTEPKVVSPADGVTMIELKRSVHANGEASPIGLGIVVRGVSKTR
jgi:hypothetical protein